jgi:uncharacterized protein (DUF305 family)
LRRRNPLNPNVNEYVDPHHKQLLPGYAADVRWPLPSASFALAALTLAAFLASCSGVPEASNSSSTSADSTAVDQPVITGVPAGYNDADVAFAQAVISWQQQRIDLSALAGDRSGDVRLTDLATETATSLKVDSMALAAFAVDWRENPNSEPNADPDHGIPSIPLIDRATQTRLNSTSGRDFDTLWLQSMIALDRAAIETAEAQTARGQNVDAVSIARKIAGGYRAEIDRMMLILGSN